MMRRSTGGDGERSNMMSGQPSSPQCRQDEEDSYQEAWLSTCPDYHQ